MSCSDKIRHCLFSGAFQQRKEHYILLKDKIHVCRKLYRSKDCALLDCFNKTSSTCAMFSEQISKLIGSTFKAKWFIKVNRKRVVRGSSLAEECGHSESVER